MSASQIGKAPSFIPEFEGLRGILAWWVVLFHMAVFSGFSTTAPQHFPLAIILHGGTPVEVFITLSGFVIFFLLDKESGAGVGGYIVGRAFRIIPVYWVLLTIAAFLLPIERIVETSGSWLNPADAKRAVESVDAASSHLGLHYGLHLSLLHGLIPDKLLPHAGDSIIAAAWSISLEWQFYLFAPLLYFLAKQKFTWGVVLCGLILLLKMALARINLIFSYGAFLPVKFEFFCLGMGSFLVFKRMCATGKIWSGLLLLYGLVFAAFVLMFFTGGMREHSYAVGIWLLCFTAAMLRLDGNKYLSWLSKILCSKPVAAAGKVSYSTYLCHQMLLWLIFWFVGKVFGLAMSSPQVLLHAFLIGVPVVYIVSILLHKFIEMPGIALGKRVRRRLDGASVRT